MTRTVDILSKSDIQNIMREEGDKIREDIWKHLVDLRERVSILDDSVRVLSSKVKL